MKGIRVRTYAYETMMISIIPPAGTISLQKWTMKLQATISNGTRAASKMKKFHAAAMPKASSTYLPANRINGELIGKYVTQPYLYCISITERWVVTLGSKIAQGQGISLY
jgi:hypothetical protein